MSGFAWIACCRAASLRTTNRHPASEWRANAADTGRPRVPNSMIRVAAFHSLPSIAFPFEAEFRSLRGQPLFGFGVRCAILAGKGNHPAAVLRFRIRLVFRVVQLP